VNNNNKLIMNPGEEMSGKVSYDTFHIILIILVSFGLKIQALTDCTLLCSTSNMPTYKSHSISLRWVQLRWGQRHFYWCVM
jgi:hypothetical protein